MKRVEAALAVALFDAPHGVAPAADAAGDLRWAEPRAAQEDHARAIRDAVFGLAGAKVVPEYLDVFGGYDQRPGGGSAHGESPFISPPMR